MRQRKALSAYGLFYEKKAQAALSLTNAELTNGTNWQMVITIEGNTPVTIEAKVITIAHIICQVSAS